MAAEYFRSGADKVSIGSDAVVAALQFYANGRRGDGSTAIERISWAYGAQAVVVSVDPRRVWVRDPSSTPRPVRAPCSTPSPIAGTCTPSPPPASWVRPSSSAP
ncbi:MAG: hypothetical protein K2X91_17765 [Thermoleophilia bacterium]|nr:hypothetical protein [Thermoleophilia bacterium]